MMMIAASWRSVATVVEITGPFNRFDRASVNRGTAAGIRPSVIL
jgi:hypothetical protein